MIQFINIKFFNWRAKKISPLSLSSEYFIYSLLILSSIFIVSVFLYCYSYSLYVQEKQEELQQASENIHRLVFQVMEKNQDLIQNFNHIKEGSTAAVSLTALQKNTNEQINKLSETSNIHFMVVNEQCHSLFQSGLEVEPKLKQEYCQRIFWKSSKNNAESLLRPYGETNEGYLFHKRVKNHPEFTIITRFDKAKLEKDLHRQFFPRVCELLLMGLFCLIILYFFRRKIIMPISILSDHAIQISKGKTNKKIPRQNSIELFNLAKALLLVKRYIKRNELYREKLERINEIVKTSAEAREDFVKSLNKEFLHSLKDILICTELLLRETEQNVTKEERAVSLKCIDKIREAVRNIKSKTSNTLNLSCYSFNNVVNEAIQINLKASFARKITINANLSDYLPILYGDVLKIKQIIVHLLSQSIENSTEGQEIVLTTTYLSQDNHGAVQLMIKDFGFGLSDSELQRMQKNIGWITEDTLFSNMDNSLIEKVMAQHDASIFIENKLHEGRTIFLTFPIQKEYEHKIGTDSNTKSSNVFYFPNLN